MCIVFSFFIFCLFSLSLTHLGLLAHVLQHQEKDLIYQMLSEAFSVRLCEAHTSILLLAQDMRYGIVP